MAQVKRGRALLLSLGMLWLGLSGPQAHPAVAATEQQLKAVFVFNFSHFVAWPPDAFASPGEPFVIGVLGGDALTAQLQETVRDERIESRPIRIRQFRSAEEIGDCHILYIDRSQGAQLERILPLLGRRRMLTVSDLDGAARQGIMIQLATENSRIRLLINVESARAAGLTISSNLLRPAKIVRSGE